MAGHVKLTEWREREGWSQQRLAEALGCTVSTVWRYEQGLRDPDSATKQRIFLVTDGEVEPNDFYPMPLWRRALDAARAAISRKAA